MCGELTFVLKVQSRNFEGLCSMRFLSNLCGISFTAQYLFIYRSCWYIYLPKLLVYLFTEAVGSSDYVPSNSGRLMNDKLERVWKEVAVAYFKVLS
jgi:hypothetical protein